MKTIKFDYKKESILYINVDGRDLFITINLNRHPQTRFFFRVDGLDGYLVTNGQFTFRKKILNLRSCGSEEYMVRLEIAVHSAILNLVEGHTSEDDGRIKKWLNDIGCFDDN